MHVPSRPLMRSLLSQFQTPAVPRRSSRFFRVWLPTGLPRLADHSAYFGPATIYFRQPFQPSTGATLTFWVRMSTPAIGAMAGFRTGNSTAVNPLRFLPLLIGEEFRPRFAQHLPQCSRNIDACKVNHASRLTLKKIFRMVLEGGKQPNV